MFLIVDTPVDVQRLADELQSDAAGAMVAFEGRVRNTNEGRDVQRLEYEAYAAVANKEGVKIVEEAKEKFDVIAALCQHRVGELEIGDVAIWAGVLTGHREEGFAACRYIVDEIKARVPIWKKEHYQDGDTGWINCTNLESKSE